MQTFFKSDMEPRAIRKARASAERRAALNAAYEEVDARDGGYCWVTGRYTQPGAVDARVRREHHHLEPRSLEKGRIADPSNIVTVCAEAHSLFKSGWLVSEGTDTRKTVRFHWTKLATYRPFQIKSRRWSANRD